MNDILQEQLGDVFREIVEQQACMFCAPPDGDEIPAAAGDCIKTSIAFSGQRAGALTLLAPPALTLELAANMLGLDPDDEAAAEAALDSVGELMNVVLGQLLTRAFSLDAVFDLSTPQVTRSVTAEEWRTLAAAATTVQLVVEDHQVLITCDLADVD